MLTINSDNYSDNSAGLATNMSWLFHGTADVGRQELAWEMLCEWLSVVPLQGSEPKAWNLQPRLRLVQDRGIYMIIHGRESGVRRETAIDAVHI